VTFWRRISLIGCAQHDKIALGEPVIILHGLIPVTLAAWSLLFSGTKFEYMLQQSHVVALPMLEKFVSAR